MRKSVDSSDRPVPLKPFLFRIREGFLLGLAMEPSAGSPCAGCVQKWLEQRGVWCEKVEMAELKIRRDLLGDLLSENSGHVFYEISHDGLVTRLDCMVFPHTECACQKGSFIAPREVTKKTNFAFSPISHIQCARFGTPEGNLWLTSATGELPLSEKKETSYAVDADREVSRMKAVEGWMKKAALAATAHEPLKSETLQTGALCILPPPLLASSGEVVGAGTNREEATLDALFQLARTRTLRRYAGTAKSPMLVVGANNWIRTRVPFFLLQQYDFHLLFYPNSMPAWVVGIAAFSRQDTQEKPIFVFGSDAEIGKAFDMAFGKILEVCQPGEEGEIKQTWREEKKSPGNTKLNLWWTHWIYRCPKISLKDVLHLEPYPRTVEHWREFLRDGEDPIGVVGLNTASLPQGIRYLVRLYLPGEPIKVARNVNGIGTWRAFQETL